MSRPDTSFARLSPTPARRLLVLAGLFAALCVAVSLSPLAKGNAHRAPRAGNDIALYKAEVERLASGEPYYPVAGAERRARGYPAASVFNWRTPGLAWVLAALPNLAWGKALLGAVCLAALLMSFEALARDAGVRTAALGTLLLVGALLLGVLGDSLVMPVVWSGALLAASLAAYGIERRGWGVACGLAALFVRELAGPYCAIALVIAARRKRWREAAGWLAGFAAYAAFYAWHIAQVHAHRLPTDEAHAGTWLQAGGLSFVISLAQVQAVWIVLPQAVAALSFAAAMFAAAAANTPFSNRVAVTLAAYVALFGLVGYDFNQYWGVLVAPLFALATARAPAAAVDLWRAAEFPGLGSVPAAPRPGN